MKTPTLEEVKEYFKYAKEVKCIYKEKVFTINLNNFFDEYPNNIWVEHSYKDYKLIWSKKNGYAEIISYKDEQKTDSIVESVINQFKERSEVGIKKYGTTLDRNDLTTLEWINHAQQEAMDFVLYLEKLKREYGNYKTTLETSRLLKLSVQRINERASILGFNRFSGRKRILNDSEVEKIKNFNNSNDLRNIQKFSPKKINVINFYLTHRNNSCIEIAEKMGVEVHFVSNTINEWFDNNNTITVASKI